jgi:hypothetical protein
MRPIIILPGIIINGKEQPFARPQAGMIFYNDEGSENGGLIFGGHRNAKGEVVDSGGSLSFDKYGANQIVQLLGVDDKEDRFAGLSVTDSLTGTENRRRIWIGRDEDGCPSVYTRVAYRYNIAYDLGVKAVFVELPPFETDLTAPQRKALKEMIKKELEARRKR